VVDDFEEVGVARGRWRKAPIAVVDGARVAVGEAGAGGLLDAVVREGVGEIDRVGLVGPPVLLEGVEQAAGEGGGEGLAHLAAGAGRARRRGRPR
jgi:hypothetical protein